MANDAKGNPILIDTAGVVTADPVRVVCFIYKPNTASDQVVLEDKIGRTILDIKANATTAELQIVVYMDDTRFYGITCSSISSGSKLYAYLNPTC